MFKNQLLFLWCDLKAHRCAVFCQIEVVKLNVASKLSMSSLVKLGYNFFCQLCPVPFNLKAILVAREQVGQVWSRPSEPSVAVPWMTQLSALMQSPQLFWIKFPTLPLAKIYFSWIWCSGLCLPKDIIDNLIRKILWLEGNLSSERWLDPNCVLR